ncbi:MAG: hypothetical protein HZA90_15980 [Verrucomicrobia bacterium]|nr:hypothetical protein [Verrucomicrobiota bacterium]
MSLNTTTVKGIWWLADQPDRRLQGEATYGPICGGEIDLFGHLYESFDDRKLAERFTLHGLTFKTKPVSLFECLIRGSEMNLPGGSSCKITSASGIVGGHFRSLNEVAFKEMQVQFKGLGEWVWTSGLTFTPGEDRRSFTASYCVPETIPLGRFGPLSLRIEFSGNVQPDYHSLQVTEDCVLIIEADTMQPYATFEEIANTFQRFLCLALQGPVYALNLTGRIDQPKKVVQNTPVFEDFLIIRKLSLDNSSHKKLPQDLLFTCHELGTSPASAFGKFVERQNKLEAAMDLYLSTIYGDNQPPRVTFLTLAQSLEAYHSATKPGKYMDDGHYGAGLRKRLWDAIPSDDDPIDSDFRESLRTKLDHLHRFSLNKRLKDLAIQHRGILESLMGDPKEFAKTISDLRNKLTHPSDATAAVEQDWRRLWRLSDMMALLVEVCFLDDMGFTEESIKRMVLNRSRRAYRIHRGWV